MRKQLFAIPILALLITSCAPRPIVRLSPNTDQGVWLWGQQFVFDTTTDVNVYIAFDRDNGNAHAFSVEYVNVGTAAFLVDPAQITVVTQPFDAARFQSDSFTAIDPELRLLAMDKAMSRSQAQSANTSVVAAIVLGAGMAQVVSDAHHNVSPERAQLHADLAITGAELAQVSAVASEVRIMDLANDRQVWESQAIRKTTLAPNMSIQGLIFVPKNIHASEYDIAIPVRDKVVHFIFQQKVVKANTIDEPGAGIP